MTRSLANSPPKGKKIKTEREQRLSSALRENLRKRKSQNVEREKSKETLEKEILYTPEKT
ncbi:MAG: hypothetical protein FJX03_04340 [Alphaproteobacteria bacterium]|jgi:hypothetical protein|nr:hypothetical protein [Alphaproteobacteria bacterium]